MNTRGNDGKTPLHYASAEGHADTVKLFLSVGAYKNARTKIGLTPLSLASVNNHAEVVKILKAAGGKE